MGLEFRVGERYLVYAHRAGDNKRGLVVKDCGRSRPLNEAAEGLILLNRSPNLKTSRSPSLTSRQLRASSMGTSNKSLDASGISALPIDDLSVAWLSPAASTLTLDSFLRAMK